MSKRNHWSLSGHVFIPGLCRAQKRSHWMGNLKGYRNRQLLFKGRRKAKGYPMRWYRRKCQWPLQRRKHDYHPPREVWVTGGGT